MCKLLQTSKEFVAFGRQLYAAIGRLYETLNEQAALEPSTPVAGLPSSP